MSSSPPPLVQDDSEVRGPHLPAGHPYWTTDWDSLYWPRPAEERAWAEGKGQHRGKKESQDEKENAAAIKLQNRARIRASKLKVAEKREEWKEDVLAEHRKLVDRQRDEYLQNPKKPSADGWYPWLEPWFEIPAPGRAPEEGMGVLVVPEKAEMIDGNPVWTYVSLSPANVPGGWEGWERGGEN